MRTIKVSEATNIQLDWLVWKCAGGAAAYPKTASGKAFSKLWHGNSAKYVHPTTDWAHGGPIIERGRIGLLPSGNAYYERDGGTFYSYGPTALIAAARCYCCAELGDVVEVPKELT